MRRDSLIALIAVLLAFAAFDDITTDKAETFTVERVALVLCAAALFSVCWNLVRRGHKGVGSMSWVALIAGAAGGARIGPPSTGSFETEYHVAIAALLWFLGVAAFLLIQSWRPTNPRVA
jgi:hypothetical protein